jgi:prefoldin subunit 5
MSLIIEIDLKESLIKLDGKIDKLDEKIDRMQDSISDLKLTQTEIKGKVDIATARAVRTDVNAQTISASAFPN